MKGSKLLQIAGIIMIVGAILGLALVVIALLGYGAAFSQLGFLTLLIAFIVPIVTGLIQLWAGIAGAKNWNNPAKAQTCITLGIIVIVLSLASNIYGLVAGAGLDISSLIIGLILPVLYLIGAFQLKNS